MMETPFGKHTWQVQFGGFVSRQMPESDNPLVLILPNFWVKVLRWWSIMEVFAYQWVLLDVWVDVFQFMHLGIGKAHL